MDSRIVDHLRSAGPSFPSAILAWMQRHADQRENTVSELADRLAAAGVRIVELERLVERLDERIEVQEEIEDDLEEEIEELERELTELRGAPAKLPAITQRNELAGALRAIERSWRWCGLEDPREIAMAALAQMHTDLGPPG